MAAGDIVRTIGLKTTAENISGLKTFNDGLKVDDDINQNTLSYYRELNTTFTFVGSGGGGTSNSTNVRVTRVGRVVTLEITRLFLVVPVNNSGNLGSSANLPDWARPAQILWQPAWVWNNGSTWAIGLFGVQTDGKMMFIRDNASTPFTNGAAAGFETITVSYSVA